MGILVAGLYFSRHDYVDTIDKDIERLRVMQDRLRKEAAVFKGKSDKAIGVLRQKGLSLDEYVSAIDQLQKKAEKKVVRNVAYFAAMTPEERMQDCLKQIKEIRKWNEGR